MEIHETQHTNGQISGHRQVQLGTNACFFRRPNAMDPRRHTKLKDLSFSRNSLRSREGLNSATRTIMLDTMEHTKHTRAQFKAIEVQIRQYLLVSLFNISTYYYYYYYTCIHTYTLHDIRYVDITVRWRNDSKLRDLPLTLYEKDSIRLEISLCQRRSREIWH